MGEVLQLLSEALPLIVAAPKEFIQHQKGAVHSVLPREAAFLATVALVLKACPYLCQTLLVPGEGLCCVI